MDTVKSRMDRLKTALSDGVFNNEDIAAANSLGLNIRALMSTDGDMKFTNGQLDTSTPQKVDLGSGTIQNEDGTISLPDGSMIIDGKHHSLPAGAEWYKNE